jgi:hypothetical protein
MRNIRPARTDCSGLRRWHLDGPNPSLAGSPPRAGRSGWLGQAGIAERTAR